MINDQRRKKTLLLIAMFLFAVLSFFGCSKNERNIETEVELKGNGYNERNIETEVELKGNGYYVMAKETRKILLVNTEREDFSSTGGVEEHYDAIWLSNAPEEVTLGELVQFTVDGVILESYPGIAKAKSISIIPSQKPVGANLLVSEALNSALKSKKVDPKKVMVVKSIRYNRETKQWKVSLKETFLGGKEISIIVADK